MFYLNVSLFGFKNQGEAIIQFCFLFVTLWIGLVNQDFSQQY